MTIKQKALVADLKDITTRLALPNGRKVGSEGHAIVRNYLLEKMEQAELVPFAGDSFELGYSRPHPSTREPQEFYNLIGVVPGKNRTLPPILVGAHYDSVIDAPCADDNATSVAKTMVLAEYYKAQDLERDLIIAFFDAEEPPFFLGESMGSRRFCEDYCGEMKFAAVIISDLIGHDANLKDLNISLPKPAIMAAGVAFKNVKKLVAIMGAETSAIFPDIIEQAADEAKGIKVLASQYHYVGPVSDHAAFAEASHPFLFLSCGQGKYYHHENDDLKWINFDKLAYITRYVSDLIEKIDNVPASADRSPQDPFEMEMRMLRKSLGPMLPVLLKFLKIKMPESREELEQLVDKF